MEMQQLGFHAVNMSASPGGNHELPLSSTSSPVSTTSSASGSSGFSSSPHHTSSTSTRTVPPPHRHRSREQVLKSFSESTPHSMKLRQLHKSERAHQKDASFHKKRVRRTSDELHQIVGLYALLQGVVFAAVAQSTGFTCADVRGPIGALIVLTIGTIIAVVDKLRDMGHEKQEVNNFQRRQSNVYDKIAKLYFKGSNCKIEDLEPQRADSLAADSGVSAHGLLVVGFLVGFSVLVAASCISMLCNPCRRSQK